MGEWLQRKLQRQAQGRAIEWGDLLHIEGSGHHDRALAHPLQHRPTPPRAQPADSIQAYQARPKALPSLTPLADTHYRIRHDKIDPCGVFTLRHNSRLHHIGIGRRYAGTNAFVRDGDSVFRTYFINSRGDEAMGSTWSYLDITALGRQEEWEDSPEGYPQTPPYKWWNWHDEYDNTQSSQWSRVVDRSLALLE